MNSHWQIIKGQNLLPTAPNLINVDIHSDNEYKGYKTHMREKAIKFHTHNS